MTSSSCLYTGAVLHRRVTPREHSFRQPLFFFYLDLAELPRLLESNWWLSEARFAPIAFRRSDYLGDPQTPLDQAVRKRVTEVLGEQPQGPIRLLTHLRYWGYCFNPVSFYYCFDRYDEAVECIVADVTNTPWGESHSYVVPFGSGKAALEKSFHVSPFMPMDLAYDWTFSEPGNKLMFSMAAVRRGEQVFDAQLLLERRALSVGPLLAAMARHPWMTAQVSLGIYWQALRLRAKRTPFYSHPKGERQ